MRVTASADQGKSFTTSSDCRKEARCGAAFDASTIWSPQRHSRPAVELVSAYSPPTLSTRRHLDRPTRQRVLLALRPLLTVLVLKDPGRLGLPAFLPLCREVWRVFAARPQSARKADRN